MAIGFASEDMESSECSEAIRLVEAEAPVAQIYWWSRTEANVASFAASELQGYLEEITGARLPVQEGVFEDTNIPPSLTDFVLIRNEREATAQGGRLEQLPTVIASITEDAVSAIEGDGFTIQGRDGDLLLAGAVPRGTVYAAYALLEQLGVRFFAPKFEFYERRSESIPTKSDISVPASDFVSEPDLAYRRKDVAEGRSHTATTLEQLIDWMAKTRHNILSCPADFSNLGLGVLTWDRWREDLLPELRKRGLLLETGGHGFDSFLPPEIYSEDHPEWFVEGYNVFNITQSDAVDQYIENVLAYLTERPEIRIFDVWPPDASTWPPTVIEEFGSIPNAYAHIVNRIHSAIEDEFPEREITLEALAYGPHIQIPDSEYMFDDSIVVDFAPIDRSYVRPIFERNIQDKIGRSEPKNYFYIDLLEDWNEKFTGDIIIYEYYRKYSWHSLPGVPQLIGEELPHYASLGVDGIGTYSEPADWIPYELTHLMVASRAWHCQQDSDRYLRRYVESRFGPVADDMAMYFDLVEEAGRALFDGAAGSYNRETPVLIARSKYQDAYDTLAKIRTKIDGSVTPDLLLQRLAKNVEFAIADTNVHYYQHQEDDEKESEAAERARELVNMYCFHGTVMKSPRTLGRFDDSKSVSAEQCREDYRREWR